MNDRGCQRLVIAAFGSTIAAGPAFAQDASSCVGGCPDEVPIIITGSRLPGPDKAPAPLERVDSAAIDRSGVVNIQDLLDELPQFGRPAFNRTNSNFHTDAAGMATVNLRNLGESRTLVLINGRRVVPSLPGTGVVDLNSIPTQLISRVEVLTGGASSIYGSDAVAGVVNIILDDRLKGLKAEAQSGISELGDDVRRQASLTYGSAFGGGRGQIVLHAGWSDEDAILSRSRKRTRFSTISCFTVADGSPFEGCATFLSSITPEGRIDVGPTDASESFTFFGTDVVEGRPQGFNFNAYRLIAIPTERYLLNALGHYDFADRITATFEASFARSQLDTQLEPVGLSSLEVFPESDGHFDVEQDLVAPDGTLVRVRNPFIPDMIFQAATDTNGDGLRDVGFSRRMSEFGTRGADAERKTWRLLGGLEGELNGDWRSNAFFSHGRSTEKQVMQGLLDLTKFAAALQVVPDAFDQDGDGNVAEAICLDAAARAAGCVPANLFAGAGGLAPTVAWLQVQGHMSARLTQDLAGATASGTLLRLPGGPVQAAVGAEYRNESTRFNFDELTQAGLNGSIPLTNIEGGFHVYEGYGELSAPIIANRRWIESLTLRGAVRVAHYSTIGTSWNWSYGAEYSPIRGLRLRASKAKATRAPNIGELFAPAAEGLEFFTEDPCIGVTNSTPGPLGTTCRSYPGVVANIAQNGTFTVNNLDSVFLTSFGGNPDLQEEKSNSITIGLVVNPVGGALRDVTFTLDYFDIDVADAIFPLTIDGVLNECFNRGNLDFCDFVSRRVAAAGGNSAGSLERVDARVVNSGGLEVSGIDATLAFGHDLARGRLNLNVTYTHLFDGFVRPLPGSAKDEFAGEIGSSRDRALATLDYDRGKWGATLRANYIGPAYLDDQITGVESGSAGSGNFKTDAELVMDAQIRFAPSERIQVYFGADNLFNNAPPLIGMFLNGDPGVNTDAGTYDAIGRRFYAGARLRL